MTYSTDVHDPLPSTGEPAPPVTSGGKLFTVREVVATCGISESTAKRRLRERAFPNAYQASAGGEHIEGTWLIPLSDLLAAGYNPGRPTDGDPQAVDLTEPLGRRRGGSGEQDEELSVALNRAEAAEAELERVKVRAEALDHRAHLAETLAAERERMIRGFEQSMRLLEAGSSARSEPSVRPRVIPGRDVGQRRRWWQRAEPAQR